MKPYYQDDACEIYHGDCREVLPGLGEVDLVLTDPPYGVGLDKFRDLPFGRSGKLIAVRKSGDTWDSDRPSARLLESVIDAGHAAIVWGGNFFADILPRSTHWISWDKLQTMPSFGDCELAWTNIPRKSVSKVTVQWCGLLGKEQSRQHPTQKPLALMVWCIETYSKPCTTILDPFMGSGTTLRAAKDLGRKAIGIEIEEKYCEVAAGRLAQEVLAL